MSPSYSNSTAVTWRVWMVPTPTETTSAANVWTFWTGSSSSTTATNWEWGPVDVSEGVAPPPLSDEELQRIRNEREEEVERARKRNALAEKRAESLLRSLLDPAQRRELAEHGHFTVSVETRSGPRSFQIARGRSGNVSEGVGVRRRRFCIHPRIACPDADTMAAQKLMLETDLEGFLRVANVS